MPDELLPVAKQEINGKIDTEETERIETFEALVIFNGFDEFKETEDNRMIDESIVCMLTALCRLEKAV
jgi:hypothetical protein